MRCALEICVESWKTGREKHGRREAETSLGASLVGGRGFTGRGRAFSGGCSRGFSGGWEELHWWVGGGLCFSLVLQPESSD